LFIDQKPGKAHDRDAIPYLIIEEEDWTSLRSAYASIGITEVWQFALGRLTMYRMDNAGEYRIANSSTILSQLSIERIEHFMDLSRWKRHGRDSARPRVGPRDIYCFNIGSPRHTPHFLSQNRIRPKAVPAAGGPVLR